MWRRAWEVGRLAKDLRCPYLRVRRWREEGDGGYGRQNGWTRKQPRLKISAWDGTELHTQMMTDKTLECQCYRSLKDTEISLVPGRTAMPSRQGEWSVLSLAHTHTEEKKNNN